MPEESGVGRKDRACPQCGRSLAPTAVFCRYCGARYEEPPPPPPSPPPRPAAPAGLSAPPAPASSPATSEPSQGDGGRRFSAGFVFLAVAVVLAGAAVAAAITLSSGGSTSTTVITAAAPATEGETESDPVPPEESEVATASGLFEAGRYVQAGSFKFAADAEAEQQRLAVAGVDVSVVNSEEAEELYPGFQVLLGGPFRSGSEAATQLEQLHRNGVPSAFARPLTPAPSMPDYSEIGRTWTGTLEESSTSHPKLDRALPVTLTMEADGRTGTLVFLDINCVVELTSQPPTEVSLKFAQGSNCLAPGDWWVRPSKGELSMSLLPHGSDVIVLGKLQPA